MIHFFEFSDSLTARAMALARQTVECSKNSKDKVLEELTIEYLIVLDQLIPLLDKYGANPPKHLCQYLIFRAYIYLQWLACIGVDTSLKISEVTPLIDAMEDYAHAQDLFEQRIKEFNESRKSSN